MGDIRTLTKRIEIDFLKTISDLLRSGKITMPRSKEAAKTFLSLLPFSSDEDIRHKIKSFVDRYREMEKFQELVLSYIDKEKTGELLDKLRLYINKSD